MTSASANAAQKRTKECYYALQYPRGRGPSNPASCFIVLVYLAHLNDFTSASNAGWADSTVFFGPVSFRKYWPSFMGTIAPSIL